MDSNHSRNEKLSHRLVDILTRLNSGESLNPVDLAHEYHTSLRTIQRDLGERLGYLPLQKVNGCFKRKRALNPIPIF